MINDQYKLDIVDRLVNCKTIKCNYVHYFMIISNYLFFDLTISCILWLLSTHEMASSSYELFLSKLTTSWCKLFLLFEKILKQQIMYGKTFYICRHAFIKDLKMNSELYSFQKKKLFAMKRLIITSSMWHYHTARYMYFKFKYRCKNLFLQPWKLLRILQYNDAIKYISHYKKYGRTGL